MIYDISSKHGLELVKSFIDVGDSMEDIILVIWYSHKGYPFVVGGVAMYRVAFHCSGG